MTDVSHICGAGAVGYVADILLTDLCYRVGLKNFGHVLVLLQRQIAWDGLDIDFGPHGHSCGPQRPVHFLVGVKDGFNSLSPHKGLHPYIGRDGADRLAAFSDDRVHPDGILVPERLSVVVDGAQSQSGSVQGIDTQVGSSPGMGATTDELDLLSYRAVVGTAEAQLSFFGVAGGVHHHGQVNVIELTQLDQFRLAAQELDFTFPSQAVPVLNLDVLFGGHGHQYDATAEVRQYVRMHQSYGGAHHHADLA